MRINFEVVKATAVRTVKCRCGKTARRARTFEFTVNPFNRNDDGTMKSREQVRAQAQAKADAWNADPYTCNSCKAEVGNG